MGKYTDNINHYEIQLIDFFLVVYILCVSKKSLLSPRSLRFSARFTYRSFWLLIFKYVIHFGFSIKVKIVIISTNDF